MKKTIFITGASSGFGKETVELFHQKGWNVVATMRSPEKETVLNQLENVFVTKLDVTDTESIASAVSEALERFGTIDVLVNNAGFGTMGALEAASDELIRKQFEVNVFGLINVTKAVLPTMRNNKSGTIVNLSSVGGRMSFPYLSLYHATKFAVEGLTESVQYELNPLGIQLKIIEPGAYKTNFSGSSMGFFGTGDLEDYKNGFHKFTSGSAERGEEIQNQNIIEVAKKIYEAVTDDTETLRYQIGTDAIQMIQAKQNMDDVSFKKMIMKNMGL
ncbi:MAG: SDR family oxidoreductase [Cyclobacteriaceae bacterium]